MLGLLVCLAAHAVYRLGSAFRHSWERFYMERGFVTLQAALAPLAGSW